MIGETVYIYDGNHRVYVDDNGNKSQRSNERLHYRPIRIVGENRVSWLGERGEKINKKTGAISGGGHYGLARCVKWTWQEVEDELYLGNRWKMAERVRNCTDLAALRAIEAILNEAARPARGGDTSKALEG